MKKLLMGMLLSAVSFGALTTQQEYRLNKYMGPVAGAMELGTLIERGGVWDLGQDGYEPMKIIRATYDFSTSGGATGASVSLVQVVPDNAIIVQSWIDNVTACAVASGSPTIAIDANSAGDVKTATACASYTGIIAGQQTGTAANMTKMGFDRTLRMAIAGGAISAGKFHVFIKYVVGD